MRTLYLIRHAKSSWDNPGLRDFDRPLNDRGQREAPKMAELLAETGCRPDLLVSSPAKRALTTARVFARQFQIPEAQIQQQPDIYEAHPRDILKIVSALPASAHTALIFGHNPTFTDVANVFSNVWIDNVPTCGIVHIESSAPTWDAVYEGNSRVIGCYFPKEVL
jgi:phosphohistidine phosphatase